MENIILSTAERTAVITICIQSPFLTCTDYDSITDMLYSAENNREVDTIVIRSTNSAGFTLGHDIELLNKFDEAMAKMYASSGQQLIKALRTVKKTVITQICGECRGPGFEIALASDIVFASKEAKFSFPEVDFGFLPGFGGTQLMGRKVHENFVKYLILTADSVSATELQEKGIISKVFDCCDSMQKYTYELCEKLSKRSIFALGLAKETVNSTIDMDFEKALLFEQNAFTLSFSSADKKEGMGAFIEKRKPEFKMRWEDFKKL